MSTVSSITSVASSSASTSDTTANTKSTNEVKKEKQKYSAFNINSLYKGKSLENPKTSGNWNAIFNFIFNSVFFLFLSCCT